MSLHKTTAANYLGQGCVAIVGLLFVPVYVDQLGVESYGLIGFYATLQSWFSLLDLGMTPTITREGARFSAGALAATSFRNLVKSFEVIAFLLAGATAAGLWLTSGLIASHWLQSVTLPEEVVSSALEIVSIVVASRFCEGIYRGVLYGVDRQVFYNTAYAALSAIRYVGAAVLVSFFPSIVAFFLWQAALSIITVIVLGVAAHSSLPKVATLPRFSFDALRDISGFAGGMFLTALVALLFTQVDKIMLTRLVDLESFGLYMLALVLTSIFPMLAGPASSAFFPRLSGAVAASDAITERDLFRLGTQIVSLLSIPAVTVCVILGNEILVGWTGDVALAEKVGPILKFVAIGAFCNAVLQIPFMLQLAHGWTTLSVRINLLGVGLLIPAIYIGTVSYGLVGAAAAWAATNIVVLFIATFVFHHRILSRELTRFLCQTLALPLIASGVTVWLTTLIEKGPAVTRLESVMIAFVGGSLAMLATMLTLPVGRNLLKRIGVGIGAVIPR